MTAFSVLRKSVSVVAAVALSAAVPAVAVADELGGCQWRSAVLERPASGGSVNVAGVDNWGRGAGSLNSASLRVVTWVNGKAAEHGVPQGFESATAEDISGKGVVAGTAVTSGGNDYQAFVLHNGTYRFLPTPSGYSAARARAINSRGDVVGMVVAMNPYRELPVLWRSGGAPKVLAELDLTGLNAVDIDDDGTVLLDAGPGPHLWKDGVLTALTLPQGSLFGQVSELRGGKVVGYVRPRPPPCRGCCGPGRGIRACCRARSWRSLSAPPGLCWGGWITRRPGGRPCGPLRATRSPSCCPCPLRQVPPPQR